MRLRTKLELQSSIGAVFGIVALLLEPLILSGHQNIMAGHNIYVVIGLAIICFSLQILSAMDYVSTSGDPFNELDGLGMLLMPWLITISFPMMAHGVNEINFYELLAFLFSNCLTFTIATSVGNQHDWTETQGLAKGETK